jgi:manganese/zinc/iron transport system substrate-binding protein
MPSRRNLIAASLATLSVAAAPAAAEEPLNAVTTVGMIADVVANIGGECVSSTALMGPGVDPHLYQATARDVRTFQTADVIFYSGYHLEGQLGDVLERLSQRIPTARRLRNHRSRRTRSSMSRTAMARPACLDGCRPVGEDRADVIAGKLAELRPDCAGTIEANAAAYGEQLAALDDWARQVRRNHRRTARPRHRP